MAMDLFLAVTKVGGPNINFTTVQSGENVGCYQEQVELLNKNQEAVEQDGPLMGSRRGTNYLHSILYISKAPVYIYTHRNR